MIPFAFWLACGLSSALSCRVALQYFQLESYQFGGYFRTLQRNWLRAFLPGFAVALWGCAAVTLCASLAFADWTLWMGLAITLAGAVAAWVLQRRLPAKKPLVFTARVKRLCLWLLAVCLGASAALAFGGRLLTACLLLPALAPLLLAAAALAALPLEKFVQHLYLRDAMKRLDAMPDLIKIGITGSYGKTSAKFMLEAILSEKYRVLVTPGSFNTSMGVTRVVRERLCPDHQVFVAEMGARHMGDIRLLCKLVRPRYGMLTSIGPQHLETFRSQENICREKFELARAIPENGAMVFADDGGLCAQLYERAACPKHLSGEHAAGLGLSARDIEVGPWGSRFVLTDGKESVTCQTRVLGAHNISNLLLACTMGRLLGMDLPSIARGAARVRPVEHRLEILPSGGGVTVIDDAFNANPVGAKAALEILREFPGRRVVVTPGFVELGAQEEAFQYALGEQIAQFADVAVLVGKRHTAPIAQGLRSKGFAEENLHVISDLAQSAQFIRPGDVVLYENDLPDNYQE